MAKKGTRPDPIERKVARLGYSEAKQRLEEILEELDRDEVDIDALADRVKEAAALVRHLPAKLMRTREEVENVLEEVLPEPEEEAEAAEESGDGQDEEEEDEQEGRDLPF